MAGTTKIQLIEAYCARREVGATGDSKPDTESTQPDSY
jgi:hypothetical protein